MAKDTKKIDPPTDIDRDLLTQADLDALEAEVQLEAEEEAREEARKRVKEKMRADARRKKGLEEAQEEVHIDLAPYCDRLLIDNVAYLQGITYTVRASLAAVLLEQMQRTWTHQSEIDGKPALYNRQRNTRFSMATGQATNAPNQNTTSSILRA